VDGTTAQAHDAGAVIYPCVAAADLDEANALTSLMTTRGDLIVRGATAAERLPKGSAGLPLVAGANDPAYTQLGTGGIANNAVTESKIADGAVTTGKIANDAVVESKLAASAVTAGKIAAGAVLESKIANGAVQASKIGAGAVTGNTIAAGAVSLVKLADMGACSVIGRSANTIGQPDQISAVSNDTVLRREANTVNFGKVTPPMLGGPRGGAWRRAAAVNVNSGSGSGITPDTTDIAYAGVSVSGSTFTVNTGYGGWWTITLMVEWSAAAGPNGYVTINTDGGWRYRAQCTASGVSSHATVTAVVPLAAGADFTFSVFQNSGSTISYTAKMHAVWLGPSA
jgi:hypothetical protein